jgi:hypothetical protein
MGTRGILLLLLVWCAAVCADTPDLHGIIRGSDDPAAIREALERY